MRGEKRRKRKGRERGDRRKKSLGETKAKREKRVTYALNTESKKTKANQHPNSRKHHGACETEGPTPSKQGTIA